MAYFEPKIVLDTAYPLKRQRGERRDAHLAFLDYYAMGAKRSIQKLLDKYRAQAQQTPAPPTTRHMTLARWSAENLWQARLDAQSDIETAEKMRVWEERRKAHAEREWEYAQALFERAETMLKYPLTEQKQTADGRTVILKPVRWRASDITRYLETANELARRALGLTERLEITGDLQVNTAVELPDFDAMDTDELEDIIHAAELFQKFTRG